MTRGREKGISLYVVTGLAAALLCMPGAASAATIAPNTGSDDLTNNGNCTLREAVQSINAAALQDACTNTGMGFGTSDRINLAAGTTYNLSLTGDGEDLNATGDLDALNDLTISGSPATGGMRPTISATNISDNDRVLHVPGSKNLTLQNLVVTGGELDTPAADGQIGGGVYFQGGVGKTLTVDNADVSSNKTQTFSPGDGGGGIGADGGGQVTVQNGSTISSNVAGPSTAAYFFGGGIVIAGNGTDLSITNSSVSGNSAGVATMAIPNPNGGFGGGVAVEPIAGSVSVTFDNATISNNRAGGNGMNVTGAGGGISLRGAMSVAMNTTASTFSNNIAGGGAAGARGDGGGMYLENIGGSLSWFAGPTVNNNTAGGGGANGFGGGIEIASGPGSTDLFAQGMTANGNQAGVGAVGQGGGIAVLAQNTNSDVVLGFSNVDGNSAGSAGGGGIAMLTGTGLLGLSGGSSSVSHNSTTGDGGGVYREATGNPGDDLERTTFAGNTGARGGGLYFGAAANGIKIYDSTISGNHATAANGGGGIYTGSNISLGNSTVYGNDVDVVGGLGGGIRTDDVTPATFPSLDIFFSTIAQNTARDFGGNLYVEGPMNSGIIRPNTTIIANGTATNNPVSSSNCFVQNPGVVSSFGYNVESTSPTQCGLLDASDVHTSPVGLGALSLNGFRDTETVPLLPGSPAIDLVPGPCGIGGVPDFDQHGVDRPQGPAGNCDAGAYEAEWFTLTVTPPVNGTITGPVINCPGDGTETKSENTQILLTANPASGFMFGSWSGGGCGAGSTCSVTLDASKTVSASFATIPPPVTPGATPTTPTAPAPAKKKCKKKKKAAGAAKKCKRKN